MHLFLTSSPCTEPLPDSSLPFRFTEANGFLARLKQYAIPDRPLVMLASSPRNHDLNDAFLHEFHACCLFHQLCSAQCVMVDDRNAEDFRQLVENAGLIILSGGHVPTQQAFFATLKDSGNILRTCRAPLLGISAGSMNAAKTVYAQPEEPGEAIDPLYRRFLPGLGLTTLNILPHLQEVRHRNLDGLRLFEDITFPDSMGRTFYAYPDGSYIEVNDCEAIARGEMHRIRNGIMQQILEDGASMVLEEA